ncbi:MAG: hypothetical protein KJ919_02930 [Verrucomicrobia bacterium]|nr:hypothetical protein [Verrucomicrobiota bacterium]
MEINKGIGLFDGNLIENSTVNYLSMSYGLGATVANNVYRNLGYVPGTVLFRQKAGTKGTFIRNNFFDNTGNKERSDPVVVIGYYATGAQEWGEVSGNIIRGFNYCAIAVSRNGPGVITGTKARILENMLFANSQGIQFNDSAYHGSGWPIDVVLKDNCIFKSGSGIVGQAVNMVRSGNFVDGKFVDDVPTDLDKNFLRVALAPAAVWHKGRIQTITVAVVGLKPLTKVEIKVSDPDGREIKESVSKVLFKTVVTEHDPQQRQKLSIFRGWRDILDRVGRIFETDSKANLQEVKETEYAHDYLVEISTAQCKVGKGTITISGQDADGKTCQVTKEFEIRKMPF